MGVILGLDYGLSDFGAAVIDWRPGTRPAHVDGQPRPTIQRALVWRSKKGDGDKAATADKIARSRSLYRWLDEIVEQAQPAVIACEQLNYMRGVIANVTAGLCWGVVAALVERTGIPLVEVRSETWRRHVARELRAKSYDEGDVHAAIAKKVVGASVQVRQVMPASCRKHALDAIGVGLCALDSDITRAALR